MAVPRRTRRCPFPGWTALVMPCRRRIFPAPRVRQHVRRQARRRDRTRPFAAPAATNRQRRCVRQERSQRLVIPQRAARMREKVRRWIPAAGYADEIAVEPARRAASERCDVNRGDALAAVRADDARCGDDGKTERTRTLRQRARYLRFGPGIDDGGDRDVAIAQCERRRIGAVVGREDDRARSRPHRITLDICERRAGEHRSGQIVVRVRDRPLMRARREDDRARTNLPQSLPRHVRRRRRKVIADTLQQSNEVAVVDSRRPSCAGAV